MMKLSLAALVITTMTLLLSCSEISFAFVSQRSFVARHNAQASQCPSYTTYSSTTTTTSLYAIGVLARKAKEADLRKYVEGGVNEDVLEKLKVIKAALAAADDSSGDGKQQQQQQQQLEEKEPGPIQQALTKRKGTISIIAEYKRKLESAGYVDEIFSPEILSPVFREFGATAIAVMADERMGGCTYDDIEEFVQEQEKARGDMPGPCFVLNNDLIVDELQIARSASCGATGVVLTFSLLGPEKTTEFIRSAKAVGLESIVQVSTREEAQGAVDAGARIISVVGVMGAEAKTAVIDNLNLPEGAGAVCTIANILARDNKQMEEIEEAWICRDKGFNVVWVSDALYKSGNDAAEHPGAIISSMKAKSSVKWASPKARSGKGEGAREYLGDILM